MERIVGESDSTKSYFIKWGGLEYEHCTWEKVHVTPNSFYLTLVKEADLKTMSSFKARLQEYELRSKFKPAGRKVNQDERSYRVMKPPLKFPLHGTLHDHQLDGLNWLACNWFKKHNCILGDEMGLGKTIQAIALLSFLTAVCGRRYFLIVVPLSTCSNVCINHSLQCLTRLQWGREFNMWAPELNCVVYTGHAKSRKVLQYVYSAFLLRLLTCARQYELSKPYSFNAIVTSWEMFMTDRSMFKNLKWDALVCHLSSVESLTLSTGH